MPIDNMSCGVVGAGSMGSEIAFIFALAGWQVLLTDQNAELLRAALCRLDAIYDKGAARNVYMPAEKQEVLGRIQPVSDLERVSGCSFVTEAVFEDEAINPASFARSIASAPPTAFLRPTLRRFRLRCWQRRSRRHDGSGLSGRTISRQSLA
jgi:3-hydroxyacyl-CoA dehydrogenase